MDRRSGDALRLTATFAVLAIHCAGVFESRLVVGGAGGWQAVFAATMSQFARFSVPVFMVLSGYGLTASRIHRGEGGLAGNLAMWRRQFLRIGLPFLLFTLIGLTFRGRFGADDPLSWPITLGNALVKGRGDYHLYFLTFLLQSYIFLPLLMRCSWGVVAGLLLLQLYLGRPGAEACAEIGLWRPSLEAYWCPHWLGYVALGCRLARRDSEKPLTGAGRWPWAIAALACGGWCLADFLTRVAKVPDAGWANHFFRASVMAYSVTLLMAWRAWGAHMASQRGEKSPKPGALLAKLTALSFLVYLGHTWVLRGLAATPIGKLYPLLVIALVVGAFGAAWILDRTVKWKWPRIILGL